jgi:hypothetical protein
MLSLVGIFDKALSLFKYSETSGFQESITSASIFSTSSGALAPVIAKDLGYLDDGVPATVAEALSVPAIYRAIALYSTAVDAVKVAQDSPSWLSEGLGSITPEARLIATVQDLIFHRESVWMVERDGNAIIAAIRLPYELWGLDYAGNIVINGEVADQSRFLYFSSVMPLSLLTAAADTIEHYLDLRNTIRSRSKNPIPLVELHITDEFEGTSEELKKALADWTAARQSENGAVAFTPKGIELKTPGAGSADDGAMLIQARNAVRLDVANFLNINASLLEGANGTSDTYENTLQSKDEFLTLSLGLWLGPIAKRLSMPDAVGAPVSFDLSALEAGDAKGNTGTATAPITKEVTA